jgi:hypothetical protein
LVSVFTAFCFGGGAGAGAAGREGAATEVAGGAKGFVANGASHSQLIYAEEPPSHENCRLSANERGAAVAVAWRASEPADKGAS